MNIVSPFHAGTIMPYTINYPCQYYKTETSVWAPKNRNLCRIHISTSRCWGVLSFISCWVTDYNPIYFLFISVQNWEKSSWWQEYLKIQITVSCFLCSFQIDCKIPIRMIHPFIFFQDDSFFITIGNNDTGTGFTNASYFRHLTSCLLSRSVTPSPTAHAGG